MEVQGDLVLSISTYRRNRDIFIVHSLLVVNREKTHPFHQVTVLEHSDPGRTNPETIHHTRTF